MILFGPRFYKPLGKYSACFWVQEGLARGGCRFMQSLCRPCGSPQIMTNLLCPSMSEEEPKDSSVCIKRLLPTQQEKVDTSLTALVRNFACFPRHLRHICCTRPRRDAVGLHKAVLVWRSGSELWAPVDGPEAQQLSRQKPCSRSSAIMATRIDKLLEHQRPCFRNDDFHHCQHCFTEPSCTKPAKCPVFAWPCWSAF